MAVSLQTLKTMNLMVPAQGGVDVMSVALPLNGDYTVNFNDIIQQQGGQLFVPQAATIDLSGLAAGVSVTFAIPQLGYSRIFEGGTTTTFQFPALQNLVVTLTPSAGTPTFNTFWYNWPAFPDGQGGAAQIVTDAGVNAQLADILLALQQPPGSIGTDASANAPALAANLLATIAQNSLRKGFFVQNQDTDPIQVVIDDGAGANVSIIYLAGAASSPGPGGSVDMSGMPTQGRIRVFSDNASAPISAHEF